MNISDKCPKCGASPAQPFGGAIAWDCGSYSPYASGIVCQSPACLTDQRDKLAERVERLEEAGGGLLEIVEAEAWDAHLADEIKPRAERWRKAKEAKP